MRYLIASSKRPGHLFPLAMHSGEMMPPPLTVESAIGERRLTFYVGVGGSASFAHYLLCRHAHTQLARLKPARRGWRA